MNPQGHSSQNILSKGQNDPNNFYFIFYYIFFGGGGGGGGVAFNKAGEIVNLGNIIWINVLKWNVS